MITDIIQPSYVSGWEPRNSFRTFIVKSNAGESFAKVNNRVRKVCEDIEQIKTDLTTLKNKMGENDAMNAEIDKTIKALDQKKADVIKKNQELFAAANEVIEYITQNKTSKAQEAGQIANTIEIINVYNG